MKRAFFIFTILFLLPHLNYSQMIYFDFDSHSIRQMEETTLTEIYHTWHTKQDCKIELKGYTDREGSEIYNMNLSKKRAVEVADWFVKKGVKIENITISFYGETEQIYDEKLDHASINRRVDIELKCESKSEVKVIEEDLLSVWDLYKTLQKAPTQKTFQNSDGFSEKLEDGSILIISPNTYKENIEAQLNISTECFSTYNQMFLEGLTTLNENGYLMESGGMYRVKVENNDGQEAVLNAGQNIKIYIPAQENASGMSQYGPVSLQNYITWQSRTQNGSKEILKNPFSEMMKDLDRNNVSCPFFFCKIRNFFSRERRNGLFGSRGGDKTNQSNVDVFYELNKEKLSKKFPTLADFKEYASKTKPEKLKKELNKLIPGIEKNTYTLLELNSYSVINCDRFLDKRNLTNIALDIDFNERQDARLYFKNIRAVMPGLGNNRGKIIFQNIPKGMLVTLIIIKYARDKISMAKERFRIGDNFTPVFKNIDKETLNNPGI